MSADSGPGSLRDAILNANATPGFDLINFSIGTGPQTIVLDSALPTVTDAVQIDATMQPGALGLPVIVVSGEKLSGGENGLVISAGFSRVEGLVISRFPGFGMRLERQGDNIVLGNYIGTNVSGKVAAPNGAGGVLIDGSSNNLVGDGPPFFPHTGNVIAGNNGPGVTVRQAGQNRIVYNQVGIDPVGNALPNNGPGVQIQASHNVVTFNTISFNTGAGIAVLADDSRSNDLSNNIDWRNDGLAIDLGGDGPTANDSLDADAGPNLLQNYPVIDAAYSNAAAFNVQGTLHASPFATVHLAVYRAESCNDGDSGGATSDLVVGTTVMTNEAGFAAFGTSGVRSVPPGSHITMLAIDGANNTSEFSLCHTVSPGCTGDNDCDGVPNGEDNCADYPNADQVNGDSSVIDNGPGILQDDVTVPNGDLVGDACDDDRDNDQLPDIAEYSPTACSPSDLSGTLHSSPVSGDVTNDDNADGSAAPPMGTDSRDNGPSWDTDDDGVRDGIECALGTNPRDASSRPTAAQCGGLVDNDGDGLVASVERCKWGTSDVSTDSDEDGLPDCVEANDTNGDGIQTFGDTISSARAAILLIGRTMDFDLNGDGFVTFPGDTILSARMVNHIDGMCA